MYFVPWFTVIDPPNVDPDAKAGPMSSASLAENRTVSR